MPRDVECIVLRQEQEKVRGLERLSETRSRGKWSLSGNLKCNFSKEVVDDVCVRTAILAFPLTGATVVTCSRPFRSQRLPMQFFGFSCIRNRLMDWYVVEVNEERYNTGMIVDRSNFLQISVRLNVGSSWLVKPLNAFSAKIQSS